MSSAKIKNWIKGALRPGARTGLRLWNKVLCAGYVISWKLQIGYFPSGTLSQALDLEKKISPRHLDHCNVFNHIKLTFIVYTLWVKKQDTKLLPITSVILTDFQTFFTDGLGSKFVTTYA